LEVGLLNFNYGIPIEANDKFIPLYNFWNCAKNENKELCSTLRETLNVSKEQFHIYRNDILKCEPFKQALYYFIINRCSFSGSTLSGGFSKESSEKRFTESSIDRLENLNLQNVQFYNEDFIDFLNRDFPDTCLYFVDPPYCLEKSKLYGVKGDLHEDFNHEKLFEILSGKENWILTYNDCEYIRNMYKEFTIIPIQFSYGMNFSKKSSDIAILNPRALPDLS
jgi:DNA adenine methylase